MLIDFVLKEWILSTSTVGFVLTSIFVGHLPSLSMREMEVLLILLALFVAVRGLQCSGLINRLSRYIEKGRVIPPKLVAATFFLSMVVTNDVALMVVVPLTLSLRMTRRDILVILEVLAANAGSALTPFGNPQNLFIYWFYGLHPAAFIAVIAPLSMVFLIVLVVVAAILKFRDISPPLTVGEQNGSLAGIYAGLLGMVFLTVLHVLPVYAALVVVMFALLRDRQALRIDYPILLSFFFLFGLAENLRSILASDIGHPGHVFLLSAIASQLMGNVPAALLFAKFTPNWEALLWGVNVGGFGSLFGSLANLIAYKLYVTHESTGDSAAFTLKFLLMGYMAFFLAIGLYFTWSTAGILPL